MKHIVLTTLFTQKKNPVHARTNISADMAGYIKEWHESMTRHQVNSLIFHDGLPLEFVESHTNEYIKFQLVPPSLYNACDGRWPIYLDYVNGLENDEHFYIFATDISDVTMGKNPFQGQLVMFSPLLFTGDEPTTYSHTWIQKRNEDLQGTLPEVYEHIKSNPTMKLLNCGIVGGRLGIMKSYLTKMAALVEKAGPIEKTVDMSIHNYVARTYFADKLKHGPPLNSSYRKFQKNRTDVWFIHK
jgi:hypothetical protein